MFIIVIFGLVVIVSGIRIYEYGTYDPNDVVVFANHSTVPAFVPIFHYRVANNDTPLEQNYTHVRVEYINEVSKVKVIYEPSNNTVSFFINLPFMRTHFFVLGFYPGEPQETTTEAPTDTTTGPENQQ